MEKDVSSHFPRMSFSLLLVHEARVVIPITNSTMAIILIVFFICPSLIRVGRNFYLV